MISKFHLICVNTIDLVNSSEQLNQFCNYVDFIYKIRDFVNKNNYDDFYKFALDRQRVKKLPKCYVDYLSYIKKDSFRRYITKTYYSNEKFFNSIYIPYDFGMKSCVDKDDTYWHLTINSNKTKENTYRTSKGKIRIDYTSNISSTFEESKLYRIIPSRTTKYSFDKFLFSDIAKINGLFICIPYDITQEDIERLRIGTKQDKIDILNRCKIKIRFQVNFDDNLNDFISKYKVNKKAIDLYQKRYETLTDSEELELQKMYQSTLIKIKKYAKDSYNVEQYNNYLLDFNYLICGKVYRKVSDDVKNLLIPPSASWYTTIGHFAQLSFIKNCEDSFDFVCNTFNVIRKEINDCYKQKSKNIKKIENLHRIQVGLSKVFPEYELPIKDAIDSNLDLKLTISNYILKNKCMYSSESFPEIMECNPLYENSFVL